MSENILSPCDEQMDIDEFISASPCQHTLRTIIPEVFPSKNLIDAICFILYCNTNQRNNETLTENHEQIFDIIEQLYQCPEKMFVYLHKYFLKYFDINLYIIAFVNGNYELIKNENNENKSIAFLAFDKDHKVCGPLYTINNDGTRETVFDNDNADIQFHVYMYAAQLNDKKLATDNHQIQQEPSISCAQELVESSSITNQSNSSNSVELDGKTQSRLLLNQVLQQMFWLIDGLPTIPQIFCEVSQSFLSRISNHEQLSCQDTIMAAKYGIDSLAQIVQLAEQHVLASQNAQVEMSQLASGGNTNSQTVETGNESNPTSSNSDIPSGLAVTAAVATTTANTNDLPNDRSMDRTNSYTSPTLRQRLKTPYHPRTVKEYAQTGSSPVQFVNAKQRAPLEITVPPTDGTQLYMSMKIMNINNQTHPSKIIVPHKTRAVDNSLINNNDLACLNFTKCHQGDEFDRITKELHSIITTEEREDLQKKIRIHLINLYQRGEINRRMVQNQALKKCKLALWFSIREDGIYQRVSPISYSNIIEEE